MKLRDLIHTLTKLYNENGDLEVDLDISEDGFCNEYEDFEVSKEVSVLDNSPYIRIGNKE